MSDNNEPGINKTEARQGSGRKENAHVLVYGLIAIVILFALAIWYFTMTQDDTATTTDGGATVENTDGVSEPESEEGLEELPTPAPTEEAVEDSGAPEDSAIPTPTEEGPDSPMEEPVEPETPTQ